MVYCPEKKTLCCLAFNDCKMLLKTDLQDPCGRGGCVCFAHHLHTRGSACGSGKRYRDHPVEISRLLSHRCHCYTNDLAKAGWGRLSQVLCQFLGSGLVKRSTRLKRIEDVITHDYILLHICIIMYYLCITRYYVKLHITYFYISSTD